LDVIIHTVVAGGALVIETQGELDVYTAPQLQAAISEAVAAGNPKVIVDLRPVTFLDSTALGVLVAGLRQVRANGGDLRLVVDHPHINKMFRITGFDTVFSIFTSMEEAMAE
jgi:anti-sigma B factor antagonist